MTTLGWITNTTASDALTFSDISNEGSEKRAGGFTAKLLTKITAIESTLNMTSIIYVNNYAELNGTTLTCRGIKGVTTNQYNTTVSVCIVGELKQYSVVVMISNYVHHITTLRECFKTHRLVSGLWS